MRHNPNKCTFPERHSVCDASAVLCGQDRFRGGLLDRASSHTLYRQEGRSQVSQRGRKGHRRGPGFKSKSWNPLESEVFYTINSQMLLRIAMSIFKTARVWRHFTMPSRGSRFEILFLLPSSWIEKSRCLSTSKSLAILNKNRLSMSGGRRVYSFGHPGIGQDPPANGGRRGQRTGLTRRTHSALLRGRSWKQV